ncbi:MAG: membrane protein insertion efficiency factor YidD [Candidatus Glassbacteria bacterium]|nr:membrane protein insertion efficiency factor YidD [Candidatus Glassbacteria bacterium]
MTGAVQKAMAGTVGLYQLTVSRLFPSSCRFYPSCSEYARLSLLKYGPLKGLWRSVVRLSKCHPFHPGGVDHP